MKNQLHLILFLVALLLANPHNAQSSKDIVYLKNGTVLKGTIVETVPNVSLKIKDSKGVEQVVLFSNIDSIRRNTRTKSSQSKDSAVVNSPVKTIDYKQKGYVGIVEVGGLVGFGGVNVPGFGTAKNEDRAFGIRMMNGFQFSPFVSLGVTVGIEKYQISTLVPMALDLRIAFKKGKTSPVFGIMSGVAINTANSSGGFLVNPSFGFRTYTQKNKAFVMSVGYKLQKAESRVSTFGSSTSSLKMLSFNFLSLNLGLSF